MPTQGSRNDGRTGLRRRLSYDRYILAFRLTLLFFAAVTTVPFMMVILSSFQLDLWVYAIAAALFAAGLVTVAILTEKFHIQPLRTSYIEIDGDQISGKSGRQDVSCWFADIDKYELSESPFMGKLLMLVLKNGTKLTISFGLERFDYLIDSLLGYRPEFRTSELENFRQEVLVNDHLLAHFHSYVRKWHVVAYQFAFLPLLLLFVVQKNRWLSRFGIMDEMSAAAIVILNLGFGVLSCFLVTALLHRHTMKVLAVNPAETKRDLLLENKLDSAGLVLHSALAMIVLVCVSMM